MAKIIWTANAVDDVEQIGKFIERDSLTYARTVASKLFASVDQLMEFPLSGRVVVEINDPALREVSTDGYPNNLVRANIIKLSDRHQLPPN